ncbi:MAG: GNAT family N-acetyltransferase [Acidobacteriales bacterium]|nr:GNAT family N-acetyltransferase [Terriglobales bacterium]
MWFSDVSLSQRLESAEAYACAQYAETRRRLVPGSKSEWMVYAGATLTFDGADSPVTQTFGLGLFEEATPEAIDYIERFFTERGGPVHHEVSPLAGVPIVALLSQRGYEPIELSSVLYRPVAASADTQRPGIRVRVTEPGESSLWSGVSARGWTHEHPELEDFVRETGTIMASRSGSITFLAELDGQPGAAGVLCLHEKVALFAGAATVPEMRRQGLQGALLEARMRYAAEQGCDLAMMVAEAGSNSQRNAERQGFRIAYTRTKWKLMRSNAPV